VVCLLAFSRLEFGVLPHFSAGIKINQVTSHLLLAAGYSRYCTYLYRYEYSRRSYSRVYEQSTFAPKGMERGFRTLFLNCSELRTTLSIGRSNAITVMFVFRRILQEPIHSCVPLQPKIYNEIEPTQHIIVVYTYSSLCLDPPNFENTEEKQ